jgi:hypothetical protein
MPSAFNSGDSRRNMPDAFSGGGERGGYGGDGGMRRSDSFGNGDARRNDGNGAFGSSRSGGMGSSIGAGSFDTKPSIVDRFKVSIVDMIEKDKSATGGAGGANGGAPVGGVGGAAAAAASSLGKFQARGATGKYQAPGSSGANAASSAAPARAAAAAVAAPSAASVTAAAVRSMGDEVLRATFSKKFSRVLEDLSADLSKEPAKKAAAALNKELDGGDKAVLIPLAVELTLEAAVAADTAGEREVLASLLPALLSSTKKEPAVATLDMVAKGIEVFTAEALPSVTAQDAEAPAKLYAVLVELLAAKGSPIKVQDFGPATLALHEQKPALAEDAAAEAEAEEERLAEEAAENEAKIKASPAMTTSWGDSVDPAPTAEKPSAPSATSADTAAAAAAAAVKVVATGLLAGALASEALTALSSFKGTEAAPALMKAVLEVRIFSTSSRPRAHSHAAHRAHPNPSPTPPRHSSTPALPLKRPRSRRILSTVRPPSSQLTSMVLR